MPPTHRCYPVRKAAVEATTGPTPPIGGASATATATGKRDRDDAETQPSSGPASTSAAESSLSPSRSPHPSFSSVSTDSSVSLMEFNNGARVLVVCEGLKRALEFDGIFKNDTFQLLEFDPMLASNIRNIRSFQKTERSSLGEKRFAENWFQHLSQRDCLAYTGAQLNTRCINDYNRLKKMKQSTISTLVKLFLGSSIHMQSEILTLFLLTEQDSDTQYLAYLMYDMISQESYLLKPQPLAENIYNNLHWVVQRRFKVVIESILCERGKDFTEEDIDYESRIRLMKAKPRVKQKALDKLKEIQSKNNDNSHKATQYLDGLLRIPLGVYQEESIFASLEHFRMLLVTRVGQTSPSMSAAVRKAMESRTALPAELTFDDVSHLIGMMKQEISDNSEQPSAAAAAATTTAARPPHGLSYSECREICTELRSTLGTSRLRFRDEASGSWREVKCREKVAGTNGYRRMSPEDISADLTCFLKFLRTHDSNAFKQEGTVTRMLDRLSSSQATAAAAPPPATPQAAAATTTTLGPTPAHITRLRGEGISYGQDIVEKWDEYQGDIAAYMARVDHILESSVYGRSEAKRSIKQVIAQWITGQQKGYCFGFEGPPGTGKTSLAKLGLAKCLSNTDGVMRPFSFIALGGSSNGSTLEGHSYTYVGSTWGRIVDILMESKCMNPIIYIDELDKISKTEHGREIVGILTHLTDSSQNDEFVDKYFSGVPLDLSRVLFVFSYNDPDLIDPILRDRIHKIRFKPLKQVQKKVVARNYLIPQITKTIGVSERNVMISDKTLDFIIDNYTREGGVRKLKEKLFEVYRDVNIRNLMGKMTYPVQITQQLLTNDIFLNHVVVEVPRVLATPRIGLTNGLYATTIGVGGITIIECFVVPRTNFMSMELTGQQGDVMKESMAVAKTVAWNLLTTETQRTLFERSKTNGLGLHVHCPDGGTPKDGPSAGVAITLSIISCLIQHPVSNTMAVTGEIDLNGQVRAIGGLDAKIMGGYKAGASRVLYPRANGKDYHRLTKGRSISSEELRALEMERIEISSIWDALPYAFPEANYPFRHY